MLKLVQTDWGRFDLAFDDPADRNDGNAVATVVYAALFTDAEAPLSRVGGEAWERRGWYKDPQAGSGLWHVRRQPLNAEARRETVTLVERALRRHAPALEDVAVTDIGTGTAGNVSCLRLDIAGVHNGREFLLRIPL
jgi:phage gp46-like protein